MIPTLSRLGYRKPGKAPSPPPSLRDLAGGQRVVRRRVQCTERQMGRPLEQVQERGRYRIQWDKGYTTPDGLRVREINTREGRIAYVQYPDGTIWKGPANAIPCPTCNKESGITAVTPPGFEFELTDDGLSFTPAAEIDLDVPTEPPTLILPTDVMPFADGVEWMTPDAVACETLEPDVPNHVRDAANNEFQRLAEFIGIQETEKMLSLTASEQDAVDRQRQQGSNGGAYTIEIERTVPADLMTSVYGEVESPFCRFGWPAGATITYYTCLPLPDNDVVGGDGQARIEGNLIIAYKIKVPGTAPKIMYVKKPQGLYHPDYQDVQPCNPWDWFLPTELTTQETDPSVTLPPLVTTPNTPTTPGDPGNPTTPYNPGSPTTPQDAPCDPCTIYLNDAPRRRTFY